MRLRWVNRRKTAAVVHQDRPISVSDSDMVASAVVHRTRDVHLEVGELQSQNLSTLDLNRLCFLNLLRVVARIVRRGHNT